MIAKTLDLNEFDHQPLEIREAVAFYVVHNIFPVSFSIEERDRHYQILENAGYIEKVCM